MKRYKVIQLLIDSGRYYAVVQYDTGYYFTGEYYVDSFKMNQSTGFMFQDDAIKDLINRVF